MKFNNRHFKLRLKCLMSLSKHSEFFCPLIFSFYQVFISRWIYTLGNIKNENSANPIFSKFLRFSEKIFQIWELWPRWPIHVLSVSVHTLSFIFLKSGIFKVFTACLQIDCQCISMFKTGSNHFSCGGHRDTGGVTFFFFIAQYYCFLLEPENGKWFWSIMGNKQW